MLRVDWIWIGIAEAALDLSNTVAISKGVPHDLLGPEGAFEAWAGKAATSPELAPDEAAAIASARERLLALREDVRAVLAATAGGDPPPAAAVARLNAASRAAPGWEELRGDAVRRVTDAGPEERLAAAYARSAMQIAADGDERLRVCPAPSCGMYFRPRRDQQRWCSVQCGTRARVARHAHRGGPGPG